MQAETEEPSGEGEPAPTQTPPRAGDTLERAVGEMAAQLAPNLKASVSPDTLLGALGFDSLACADLTAALDERFGVRMVEADVNETRTIADVAATVRRKMPERPRIPKGVGRLQQPIKRIAGWGFRWQARLKVEGAENVPSSGPVIIAANHRAMLDVPLLVIACPRRVTFMAKRELFHGPLRSWMFHTLGGFPVRREIADVRAMDIGLAVLQKGDVLGLYPEGTRSRSRDMGPFLKGAAWLALKTGAPIVPCGISGTERSVPMGRRRPLRKSVRVAFGAPIEVERVTDAPARRARTDEITERLLEAITLLVN
jgi:1-acyl-sn-glycerol-3-phosphate acyltransferase